MQLTWDGWLSSDLINLKQPLIWGKICNDTSASIQQARFFHNLHFTSLFLGQTPETSSQFLLISSLITLNLQITTLPPLHHPSLLALKGPRVTSLIDHSLFPQVMLVTIFSLPFCLYVAGQQALPSCTPFTAVSQVSVLNSPSRWLHLSTPWFSAFTSSYAGLILVPRHVHHVKTTSNNSLLCYYKAV